MSAILAYRNLADSATLSANPGVVSGYPVSNVQQRQTSVFTRLVDTFPRYLVMDFGVAVLPRFIGLFGTNATAMVGPIGMVALQSSIDGSTWNGVSIATANDAGAPTIPKDVKVLVPTTTPARRYWRLLPAWFKPAEQPYYQVGRLWVSRSQDLVELPEGIDARWTRRIIDSSRLDAVADDSAIEDRGSIRRRLGATISAKGSPATWGFAEGATSVPSAIASLDDMQMTVGATGECVILPRTSSPLWIHRLGQRGHIPSGMELKDETGGYYTCSFEHVEER